MNRPNFLFIIADDHRHSAIGALGIEAVHTPTLDQLLADGTAFTQAHIMGSTSGAVCMPSRGMLMSGQRLFDTPDPLPDDAPLLPELLGANGYATFATAKRHKLIQTRLDGADTWQLFDLDADPWETHDLIDSAEQAGSVARLKETLRLQQRLAKDPVAQ